AVHARASFTQVRERQLSNAAERGGRLCLFVARSALSLALQVLNGTPQNEIELNFVVLYSSNTSLWKRFFFVFSWACLRTWSAGNFRCMKCHWYGSPLGHSSQPSSLQKLSRPSRSPSVKHWATLGVMLGSQGMLRDALLLLYIGALRVSFSSSSMH
ncbi:jg17414, partial [Pararge aegeria aegeria]